MPSAKEQETIITLAKLHDKLFGMEKIALSSKDGVTKEFADKSQDIADKIMDMSQRLDLVDEHGYIQNHVDIIRDKVNEMAIVLPEQEDDIELEIPGDDNNESTYQNVNVPKSDMAINKYDKAEKFKTDRVGFPGKDPFDDESLEKRATVDKKVQAKATRQDKIIKDFQRIQKQMQTHLEMYKDAEGDEAKNLALQMLKNLTPEFQAAKKKYEKLKGVKV